MFNVALAGLCVLLACSTEDPPNVPVDAPAGTALCTGALYDPCTTNDQCSSNNCHFYQQSNFTICTQPCGASTPCPDDRSGTPASCNTMGICKPSAPNACTR